MRLHLIFVPNLTSLGASSNASPCDPNFLEAMVKNIRVLSRILLCSFNEEPYEFEGLECFINAIMSELSRLKDHPRLFPSKEVEKDFWQNVHEQCDNAMDVIIPHQKANDRTIMDFGAASISDQLHASLPVRDTQRQLWEQYLHNRAPGVEADLSVHGNEGSVQVLPMAAIRIVMGMVEENKKIIADIERVSFQCH